ncbi:MULTISPECIES: DUF3135 domain-containing protein [Salinivibrio]|jgi:hypothetical protein|uniref:DUF3135 domain-containing protein n=2 Tax=Salinivibrio TaxID=51366 RepID=A0ABY7LCG1_9GAMM|nr:MULTISPECIES: DUF3135 domain-containing protein [Salinivibrio]ODP96748.1 hypothetical protein BGK46_14425 [Salinivibrio sp. DV]OOF23485.1 hypothetical protein BZJ17_04270 [Salinivibrio sp. IB574]PCE68638.1 hypothetical protein B6G00_10295 [Salinivibrio sp. YCSC6]QCF36928.1 DUF3135 domain-containing protein [Salinivibrio sp. YCSC6]QIR05069.1 DUF3135 domain-containing protein [Salinivibrio costicola]
MKTLPSFDELAALAQSDPKALEALRLKMSEEVIANASHATQPQLHAMLSHINRVIEHGKNPLHVNVMLFQALSKQYSRFATAFESPESLRSHNAEIMDFRVGQAARQSARASE